MGYYFFRKSNNFEKANEYIGYFIDENEWLNDLDCLPLKLKWCLKICRSPQKENDLAEGVDVNTHYEFYRIVFSDLKKAIQNDLFENDLYSYIERAEEIMILLEQSNERFASFGLSSADIISYVPPTVAEREKNISLHWSKKANDWYESVEKVLANVESPYQAYSQLLAYEYQTKYISNSKIKKLLTAQIVDRIVADPRLTLDEKKNLLINQTIEQIPHVNVQGSIKKNPRKLAKKLPKAELYFDAISKVDLLIPDWRDKNFDFQNVEIIDAALTLRRLLRKEWFDIDSYIESQIVPGNILYVGDLLYLIEKLRKNGLIKKSQYLKSKLLNLCLEVNLSNIPEEAIQMILYKIRPLAVNYKRDDVVAVIDSIDLTVERKYHLALLDWPLHEIALKLSDQKAILKRFLDDYINAVVKGSYYKIHGKNNLSDTILDEMELALHKYHGDILTIALATSESYYETIISKDSAYGKTAAEGYVRSVSPFWISQFYCTYDPIFDIGVAYLIAQTYESKPYESAFGCALEAIIDDDESENDYQLSQEEIQTVLNNIVSICPKAKEEIDAYLKKYPLK